MVVYLVRPLWSGGKIKQKTVIMFTTLSPQVNRLLLSPTSAFRFSHRPIIFHIGWKSMVVLANEIHIWGTFDQSNRRESLSCPAPFPFSSSFPQTVLRLANSKICNIQATFCFSRMEIWNQLTVRACLCSGVCVSPGSPEDGQLWPCVRVGGGGHAPEDGHVSADGLAFAAPLLRGDVQAWTTRSSGRRGPQRVQNLSVGPGAPCRHRAASSVFLHPSSGQLGHKVSTAASVYWCTG